MAAKNGVNYTLVFSDEFDVDSRDFSVGSDKRWTAINKSGTNWWASQDQMLSIYSPEHAATKGGSLVITTALLPKDPTSPDRQLYSSAMLQTWNKFCQSYNTDCIRLLM
jgi:beta-glucanase (GH16 family)